MKKFKIILCTLIIITITFVSIFFVGNKSKNKNEIDRVYKQYNQVQNGEDSINGTEYVTFDAFFLKDTDNDGNAESYRGTSIDLNTSDKLYLDFKVLGDVTLKNGEITFINDNVKLSGTIPKSVVVKKTIQSDNFEKIEFNNVSNGVSTLLELNVNPNIEKDIEKYSGTNKVLFKGIVVDNITKEEKEITKEISYDVDWYATKVDMYFNDKYITNMDMENLKVRYSFETFIDTSAVIRDVNINGTISSLIGEKPEDVRIYSSTGDVEFVYDDETQIFTAIKKHENNKNAYDYYANGRYYNKWYIEVTYPKVDRALYDTEVTVSVDSYSYVTNNINSGFDDVRSKTINKIMNHPIFIESEGNLVDKSDVYVGDYSLTKRNYYIDSTNILRKYYGESVNENFQYQVRWHLYYYFTTTNTDKVIARDYYDYFKTTNDTSTYTSYKDIRIEKNNNELKNTTLKLINNENDEVLYVFDDSNFGKLYEFPDNIKTIRLESDNHEINVQYNYNVEITKQIDNNKIIEDVDLATFNSYTQITSGFKLISPSIAINSSHQKNAYIKPKISITNLSTDKSSYDVESMSKLEVPIQVKISHNDVNNDRVLYKPWKKGTYLLLLSENIMDVEVPKSIGLTMYEKVKIGNRLGIKIDNTYSNLVSNELSFNIKVLINPMNMTENNYIELYSYDESGYIYENPKLDTYDVNNNGIKIDNVQYNKIYFSLNIPKELLTGSIIKNYDTNNSETVAPLVADVELMDGRQEADMEIFMINNSTNPVTDIVLMGKTGYVGNTYQIGEGDLGSEYSANIKSNIEIPSELEGKVSIYYSDKEKPTKDIENTLNNWVEEPSNFKDIKSYMIVLDSDYSLNSGDKISFTYKIDIPNKRENLLKKSYFNHGVYFNYLTSNGKYPSTVASGKLGVRISRKIDLNIKNLKIYSDNPIFNSSYVVEDEEGNVYITKTDKNGNATIKDLDSNKRYKLYQNDSTYDYVLDTEEKFFEVELDEYNNPSINIEGTYKSIDFNNNKNLNITLENETYYILRLNIVDAETNEPVANIPYSISGKDQDSSKKIYTDSNGVITINQLEMDNTYRLIPVASNDYIKTSSFLIALTRNYDTKEVNIGVEEYVVPKRISTTNSNYSFSLGANTGYTNISTSYSYGSFSVSDVFEIDLTKQHGPYEIKGNYSYTSWSYNGYFRGYLSDTNSKTNQIINASGTSSSSGNLDIKKINNRTVEGGKKYYLTLDFYRAGSSSPTANITSLSIKPIDKDVEFITKDGLKNVPVIEGNNDIKQSLSNYELDTEYKPILDVDIKIRKIKKYNLEINKVDKDSNKPLKGATFKIEGPGLPSAGKYITTDESGKATIELNADLYGSYNLLPGLSGVYYNVEAQYTVTEVLAPTGYKTDNKPIKFEYSFNVDNDLTLRPSIDYYKADGADKVHQFASVDMTEEKLSATITNNPIVKIVKVDEETHDFLPNTYFSIYKVERLNGLERLDTALDTEGNIIGEKIVIDGQEYYAVKTDKNGSLNLNLGEGTYQLKEIKASNEKYNIDNSIYYFSVGKSVGYQAEGMNLTGATALTYNEFIYTSDGGYLYTNKNNGYDLVKVDKNNNIEWKKNINEDYHIKYTYIKNTINEIDSSLNNHSEDTYEYDFNSKWGGINPQEVSDGYIFSINQLWYVKIDRDGNLIYNTAVLNPRRYDYVTDINGVYHNNYYNADLNQYNNKYELPNGNILVYAHTSKSTVASNGRYTYSYNMQTKDGTIVPSEVSNESQGYFVEYDRNGYIVNALNITQELKDSFDDFLEENGLNKAIYSNELYSSSYFGDSRISVDKDGNIYIVYAMTTNGFKFIAKFDKDYNLIFNRPLGFLTNYLSSGYDTSQIKFYEDGSFTVAYKGYTNTPELYNLFNTKYHQFGDVNLWDEVDSNYRKDSRFAVRYDSDGIITNVVELSRNWRTYTSVPDKNIISYNRLYNYNVANYEFLEDGSVIAIVKGDYVYNNNKSVFLANGEEFVVSDNANTIYIYKINPDSSIEWIKQYDDLINVYSYHEFYIDCAPVIDGKDIKFLVKSNAASGYTGDLLPSDDIELYDENNRFLILNAKLSDVVNPEAPEDFELEIVNSLKTYSVNVMTNEGGKVTVKDNDRIIYDGNGPKEIEKVKYDNNSKYDILVVPNEGYDVVSVKINGEDATYKVNEDGSLLLNKIKGVKENKDITIKFKENVSRIVVHHYLKNTTNSVYSDQVITGNVGTNYSVLPINSNLYSLAKDKNGEYILPENREGKFKRESQEIIFYYEPKMVKLIVNYYEDGTNNKLAESLVKDYVLASKYMTKALDIKYYQVSNVLGEEEGFINVDELEVTYFYKPLQKSKVIVIYKDVNNNTEFSRTEKEIDTGSYYETIGLEEIPEGYKLISIDGTPSGIAENENIIVTYNYEKKEVLDETETPNTLDNIKTYVFIGIGSLIVIIVLIVVLKLKNKKND